MKRIIALAFSDLHAHSWQETHQPHSGLLRSLKPLVKIGNRAMELDVPILFAGDLVHKPKSIDNEVLEKLCEYLYHYIQTDMICISGNHDQSQKNTIKHSSPSYIKTLSKLMGKIHCVEDMAFSCPEMFVQGIPYLKHNIGFNELLKKKERNANINFSNKLNILLTHTDLPGAKNEQGFEIKECEGIDSNLDNQFKRFDLVLCGHIHKPQQLSKKVFMLGAPYQQNKGEMGIDMGYWEVYSDASMVFKKLDLPEYKYYEGDSKPNDKHIWIPKPKKVKLIGTTSLFDTNQSKVKIGKAYLKEKKVKDKPKRQALLSALKKS